VSQAAVNAQTTAPAKLVASGDMASTLRQSPDFTTFVKALDATNLASLIQTRPNMTVFAPTNAAFAALPPGKLDALMADKQGLQKLLLHHIINAPMPASKIKGSRGTDPVRGGRRRRHRWLGRTSEGGQRQHYPVGRGRQQRHHPRRRPGADRRFGPGDPAGAGG
jgi:uncharacterized surface protein with fasciclin (FAS1) repeats